jgi:hypothetical protein
MNGAPDFRTLAMSLPKVSELPHFDSASFRVNGKIFAQLSGDGLKGLVKLSADRQEWALQTFRDHCSAEPHWGRYGWTWLAWATLPTDTLNELLAESWRAVAPRKWHALLDGAKRY